MSYWQNQYLCIKAFQVRAIVLSVVRLKSHRGSVKYAINPTRLCHVISFERSNS